MMKGSRGAQTTASETPGVTIAVHIPLDEELLRHEQFEKRLTKGIRLKKFGRKGAAFRTFTLQSQGGGAHLAWRKVGLKTGNKGTFDVATMEAVTAVVQQPFPGAQQDLLLQLASRAGSLTLEARSVEEHRAIVDGFR